MKALHGSWNLESFEIERSDGSKEPWGKSMSGLLIYSPDGFMSVGIQYKPMSENPSDILDSVLFYTGSYNVQKNKIYHLVKNATHLKRIGQKIIRFYKFENGLLHLHTPKEDFGTAHLIWKKVKSKKST